MSKFLLLAIGATLMGGCAMEEGRDTDTTTDGGSAGGGYYENLPGGSDGDGGSGDGGSTEDGGDDTGCDDTGDGGTTDGGTDGDGGGNTGDGGSDGGGTSDGGSSEPATVKAKVWIDPEGTYDVSHDLYGIETPLVCMYEVVIDGAFPSDYGLCVTTGYNVYMYDEIEYTPGAVLTIQAGWNDGVRDRYLAEYGGVVNMLEERVVIEFEDGAWQGYVVTGKTPAAPGQAGWVPNGDGSGGQISVMTRYDTDDHHDRKE